MNHSSRISLTTRQFDGLKYSSPRPLPDVQMTRDLRGLPIDKVGVCDLSFPIVVLDRKKKRQATVATISMSVSLPNHFKGTHMSRFIEILSRYQGEVTIDSIGAILHALKNRLQQTDRLFRLVKAEPFELTRGISGDWDPAFWGSPEDIDAHLMKISESNHRILQQADGFLSPEQLDGLNTLLNNSINERLAQAAAFIRKP